MSKPIPQRTKILSITIVATLLAATVSALLFSIFPHRSGLSATGIRLMTIPFSLMLGVLAGMTASRVAGQRVKEAAALLNGMTGERVKLRARLSRDKGDNLAEALDTVLSRLNEDLLWISASTRKFNLFSSDIDFSSKQLSEKSHVLRDSVLDSSSRVRAFVRDLGSIGGEVACLAEGLVNSAKYGDLLSDRAGTSLRSFKELELGIAMAETAVKAGDSVVVSAVKSAEIMGSSLSELQRSTARTAESAKRMGQDLSIIDDIVERTATLAVNATIEAVRAGRAGKGFAIVASEIRALARSSNIALERIGADLRSTVAEMQASSNAASESSVKAGNFAAEMKQLHSVFASIATVVESIGRRLAEFSEAFRGHLDASNKASEDARRAAASIRLVVDRMDWQTKESGELESIAKATAEQASHSYEAAEVLAELGSYLTIGGSELERIVSRFDIDPNYGERAFGRRSKRHILLYNLAVTNPKGALIGHLGDISSQGLLLYADSELETGRTVDLIIEAPRTTGESANISLTAKVVRVEKDSKAILIGLSLENGGPAIIRQIDALIEELSVDRQQEIHDELATGKNATDAGDAEAELEEL